MRRHVGILFVSIIFVIMVLMGEGQERETYEPKGRKRRVVDPAKRTRRARSVTSEEKREPFILKVRVISSRNRSSKSRSSIATSPFLYVSKPFELS